jgi:tagatose-6-phosphate ketose/aldose isomerase
MKILNIDKDALVEQGAIYTASEIAGQPDLWMSIYNKALNEEMEIKDFFTSIMSRTKKIILTGAGTSAFIGRSAEGVVMRKQGRAVQSIPTTHLVSHPADYFDKEVPTLLVSFARSGDSPESVASVALADQYIDECHHLIITCNTEGKLASYQFKNESYVFMLPQEANDKSLAMTGSYSGMLLSILLINEIENIKSLKQVVGRLTEYGTKILEKYAITLRNIAGRGFKRAVFLGSGPLYGTSLESELKLQELTDGKVICKHDSYLGFRHGPKAVVDETTLMVYFFSNAVSSLQYEKDLVVGMIKGKASLYQLGVSESAVSGIDIDERLTLAGSEFSVPEYFLPVPYILVGQLLGYYTSLELGLSPDAPSASGAISRVVEGVKIY